MDTRFGPRINVNIEIISKIDKELKQQITLASGNRFECNAYNINLTGIGLQIKYFLPKGLIIDMEISGTPFGLNRPMEIKGEVRYCNFTGYRKYKCGIKFLNISERHKEAIAQFISAYKGRKK